MTSVETQIFENGEWVTRTLTAEELIGTSVRSPPAVREPLGSTPKPPKHGLLTRTLIDSPITRWVHPAQLRSSRLNDVAFVGDKSVQICELGTDMELRPVAKRLYLGSRIRNSRVIGTHEYLKTAKEDTLRHLQGDMADVESPKNEKPQFQQILVLALSTGELVFLFMTPTVAGGWEFVSSIFPVDSGRLIDPGFHMAVSPDGSYLALACSQDLFIVYQLEKVEELRRQHREGLPIQPFRDKFARATHGVILKFDFLHPEHASQAVLLLIVVIHGVSRLVIYEWDRSDSLHVALIRENRGHRLDESAGLPLLVIPLTAGCQFLMVTEYSMATYTDVLSGPPTPIPFGLKHRQKTAWYHGSHPPMWTAWTRPMREESYLEDTDVIWLAREDGWVNCLHIRGDSGVDFSISMGPLEVNIDSTFTCLSIPGGEVLVVAGDYGPGGVWTVRPREVLTPIDSIQNWSPALDMALVKASSKDPKKDPKTEQMKLKKVSRSRSSPPERVFACSGRGTAGAVVELRRGIQANIGLDLTYPSPIRQCWAVPNFEDMPNPGFLMLLALPERSALLHISHDHGEVSEKDQDAANFDLLSTTLAVYSSGGLVIQITTENVTIVSAQSCYQHSISDMIDDPLATVTYAAVNNQYLGLAVYANAMSSVRIFTLDSTRFVFQKAFDVKGEVTALAVNRLSSVDCVLAGLWEGDQSTLAVLPIEPSTLGIQTTAGNMLVAMNTRSEANDRSENGTAASAITSIVCLSDDKVLVGMRDGHVFSMRPRRAGHFMLGSLDMGTSYFGSSPSYVFEGISFDGAESVLVCNGAGLALIKSPRRKRGRGSFDQIFRVWPIDASDRSMPSPAISSVGSLHQIPDYDENTMVMIAGSRILVTQLQCDAAAVPWYIPVGGTPKGLLYSERLRALVTAVKKNDLVSLHFLDPETGADLSHPIDRVRDHGVDRHVDVDYIKYMGQPDTQIVSLLTWRYELYDKMYEWFVILTMCDGGRTARIIVVSAEEEELPPGPTSPRRIRFWTQFDRRVKDAKIRAAVADHAGIFLSFENRIIYYVIEAKKFREVMRYDTQSPAIHLEIVGGHLHALTSHHSLVILDFSSPSAVESSRMQPIHTDDSARNGLYAMNVSSIAGNLKAQEQLGLVSDPMCGVYGLWSPDSKYDSASLRLTFQADLAASIRRFGHGRTRPFWNREQPRYGRLRRSIKTQNVLDSTNTTSNNEDGDKGEGKRKTKGKSKGKETETETETEKDRRKQRAKIRDNGSGEKEDILGLSLDGSLTQMSILDENEWRLLKYIQNRAMLCREICIITRKEAYGNRITDRYNYNFNTKKYRIPDNMVVDDDGGDRCDYDYYDGDEDVDVDEDDLALFDTAHSTGAKHMHVDGDVLQRCLDNEAVERLFPPGSRGQRRLGELIGEVLVVGKSEGNEYQTEKGNGDGDGDGDGGEVEMDVDMEKEMGLAGDDRIYECAYAILEYYLAPAL